MLIAAHSHASTTRSIEGVLLGVGVFILCLLGILSRPHVDLATFWPANAFMLGMLVRFPSMSGPVSWVSCAVGFFMADAVTGSSLITNVVLNGGNLLAIAAGYQMLAALPEKDRALGQPISILLFVRAIFVASLVAGLTGIIADPMLFGGSSMEGFSFWAATEMVNYAAFLPMILTVPDFKVLKCGSTTKWTSGIRLKKLMPLAALAASAAAGSLIGGPGAVAFPVPALLWCALSYNLFATACLSFVFGAWTILAIRTGVMWVGDDFESRSLLISARLGVTLVALAPLVVSSAMAARNELLDRLRVLAEHDALTGLRNRRSFYDVAERTLAASLAKARPAAIMMLDIDHFKSVNDRFGHEAGDRVLNSFAQLLERNVRGPDIVGRIGGEEFAVALPDCTASQAVAIARRVNAATRSNKIGLECGSTIIATVSIGIYAAQAGGNLQQFLTIADKALYQAKDAGRDRFELLPA